MKKGVCLLIAFVAVLLSVNIETEFNDGIMNVTLNDIEGLAFIECDGDGYTECPDSGETPIECIVKDSKTGLEHQGWTDFCMSDGSGCVITPCIKEV